MPTPASRRAIVRVGGLGEPATGAAASTTRSPGPRGTGRAPADCVPSDGVTPDGAEAVGVVTGGVVSVATRATEVAPQMPQLSAPVGHAAPQISQFAASVGAGGMLNNPSR